MSDKNPPKKSGDVHVSTPADKAAGNYCNAAAIRHSQSEFVFDFVFRVGKEGHLVSRVITNPGHAKALLAALEENIEKYEAKFGTVAPEPQPQTLH